MTVGQGAPAVTDRRAEFEATLTRTARARAQEAGAAIERASLFKDAMFRFARNRAALFAAFSFLIMIGIVVFVPIFRDADPEAVDFSKSFTSPSLEYPFGTDEFGRDLFIRTALGGRISIAIGFAATFAIMLVGVVYGAVSGFAGGRVDNAMMRFPRRPLRVAVPAVRDHHVGDLRHGQLLDDGRGADRGLVVHHRPRDARPDHHAEGERLRARRQRARRPLVPGALPALAAEHAGGDPDLRLPRPTGRRARRSVSLVPRPRHRASAGFVGDAGAGRLHRLPDAPLHHRDPEPLHRLADHQRLLHRGRAARRTRPADARAVLEPGAATLTPARGYSSAGRAPGSHPGGRRFESG